MNRRRWVPAAAVAAAVLPLLVVGPAGPAGAAPADTGKFSLVQSLTPTGSTTSAKTTTSKMAKTDPTLLNRTDSTPISVVVKLDYDSLATYDGNVAGYAATSPSVTGRPLSRGQSEQRYEQRIAGIESRVLGDVSKRVSNAKVGQRLRTVYGGVALTVPANSISKILSVPGVVAVQKDALNQVQTDASADFIGATAVYPSWAAHRTPARVSSSVRWTPVSGRSTPRSPTTATWVRRRRRPTARRGPATSGTTR